MNLLNNLPTSFRRIKMLYESGIWIVIPNRHLDEKTLSKFER